MATTEEKKSVILDTSADWRKWLHITKTVALCGKADVWEYVDPSIPEASIPKPPVIPVPPKPSQFGAGTIVDLTANQLNQYNSARAEYKDELAIVKDIKEGINKVLIHINTTISARNIIYVEEAHTPHKALRSLLSALSPSRESEKRKVADEYNALKQWGKKEKIDTWIRRWENTYSEAVKLDLPEIQGTRPCFDFATAIASYNESLSLVLTNQLLTQEEEGKTPSLTRLIERFRQEISRMAHLNRSKETHSAFASACGNSYKGNSQIKSDFKTKPSCPCGKQHFYSSCFYFNSKIRAPGWKPDEGIQKELNKKLEDPVFKARIERSLARAKEFSANKKKESGTGNGTVATTHHVAHTEHKDFEYVEYSETKEFKEVESDPREILEHQVSCTSSKGPLYRCWTLDGASDIHLINHREGFTFQRKAFKGESVRGGTQTFQVEEYGTATVSLQTPYGKGTLTLVDVAYIPGYLTNVVSLIRLVRTGVHWDTRKLGELSKGTGVFAYLERVGDHWVLQSKLTFRDKGQPHQEHKAHSISTRTQRSDKGIRRSTQSIESVVSGELAHKIMAHPSPEVIDHLEGAVKGLKIDKKLAKSPTSTECITCAISKPVQIISRRSESEEAIGTSPGESWSWDLIYETLAYNSCNFCSHFQDLNTGYNRVFTQTSLGDTLHVMERALQLIKSYGYTPKHIQLDGGRTLQRKWKELLDELRIQQRQSATGSPQQSKSERAGRLLTVKARAMLVEANMPRNMWPEA